MLPLKSLCAVCSALITVFLIGCSTYDTRSNSSAVPVIRTASLQSHHWTLKKAIDAKGAPDSQWQLPTAVNDPAHSIEINFLDGNRVSVSQLCNRLSGDYSTHEGQIKIERIFSSMMSCSDGDLMQLESKVAQHLLRAARWKIIEAEIPVLELKFDDGSSWQLGGEPTPEALHGPGTRIFLEVAADTVACDQARQAASRCLQVRQVRYDEKGLKQPAGPWSIHSGTIEGYQHQPGVRNVLRVERFNSKQASADSASHVDILDLVVESEVSQ